ncbi:MAG: ATP-binding cassette domain-containing protein [Eggerthellaceae bacterium]|nr:ATP-binding cassette domain-containing protein [Eggerthellaceae bacterium]
MLDKELFRLPGIKLLLGVMVALSFLEAVCIIGEAWGLSHALVALWQGAAFEQTFSYLAVFGISFLAVRVVLNAREAYVGKYAYKQARAERSALFESIFRTGAPAVQAFGTGTTATMALEGVDAFQKYLETVLPNVVKMVVLPLVFAIVIFCADWVSGIIVVLLLPAMIMLMVLIGKTTAEKSQPQHATFKMMSNHFIDSVRGVATLNTFKISKDYARRIFTVSEQFRKATMETLKTATLSGATLDMFATLALAAVAIMLGMRLIDGSLALLPALFVLILVPEYFRPIREFAADFHANLEGKNSLHTISAMREATRYVPPAVEVPTWNETSTLFLHEVEKVYDGVSALRPFSGELQGYARVGVIGASGSGKSTLLRLLAGLEDPTISPRDGSATSAQDAAQGATAAQGVAQGVAQGATAPSTAPFVIRNGGDNTRADRKSDTIPDREMESIALDSLRQASWQDQIAYIPQDPYIFHATVRDNLAFYNPEASDAQIMDALHTLGLTQLLEELPQGLDTLLGEGGRELSGGQAQRIALARVFLDSKRKILLFDEPTAHLDVETEYELKAPMLALMQGKLVVFATHRLHWLDAFDVVYELDDFRAVGGDPAC